MGLKGRRGVGPVRCESLAGPHGVGLRVASGALGSCGGDTVLGTVIGVRDHRSRTCKQEKDTGILAQGFGLLTQGCVCRALHSRVRAWVYELGTGRGFGCRGRRFERSWFPTPGLELLPVGVA